ncbi:hypothetical protein TNCV_2273041 [Trichonephila clavipes]|nr:hypothetical protein TNCV_2273041 [Trichonephila clavipes]
MKRFPPRLCTGKGGNRGSMMFGRKPLSQKIRLTPESFEKWEALRYREGAKHLLTACRTVYFAMFFGASIELHSS